jgi:hypothetical protein
VQYPLVRRLVNNVLECKRKEVDANQPEGLSPFLSGGTGKNYAKT